MDVNGLIIVTITKTDITIAMIEKKQDVFMTTITMDPVNKILIYFLNNA